MKCEKCPADSALGCTAGVKPYQLRSGDTGCAWNLRIIKKHMNQSKPITNADRIRSMSDEELDNFLGDVQWDVANYCGGVSQRQNYPVPEEKGAWLDWLKQETE